VKVVWVPPAVEQAREHMKDQTAMRELSAAVTSLADDPEPPGAFVRGSYRRLRAGDWRVQYEIDGAVVTVVRVDRVS
jgi:mRNA-degrading endonuclease RelE of RelBE toxin-antitoxin system